jgi:hypothetical protein
VIQFQLAKAPALCHNDHHPLMVKFAMLCRQCAKRWQTLTLLACEMLPLLLASPPAKAQTNVLATTNPPSQARAEGERAACIQGRRSICGKVEQIQPDGIVVDSGYASLLQPIFNQSWVVPGNVSARRDPTAVEATTQGAAAIGLVFVTDLPRSPAPKLYDYVVIPAYPVGDYTYVPVPGVQKKIRKFCVGLESAVKLRLQGGANPRP